jgi:DNA polymerase III alpha subunit (gram-positive type)
VIGSELLRYQADQEYVIFDFETSGLNLFTDVPWQCSFIICTLDRIIETHDYYIKWDNLKVSRGAATVTGFNMDEYKRLARDPKEVLDIFESAIRPESRIPLGHNIIGYDTMIHQVWRRRLGLPADYSYLTRSIDTNALVKAYKKGFKIDQSNLLAFQYKMLNYRERGLKSSLSSVAREFGISFNEYDLHKGHKDIELNWQVWRKLVWSVEI